MTSLALPGSATENIYMRFQSDLANRLSVLNNLSSNTTARSTTSWINYPVKKVQV